MNRVLGKDYLEIYSFFNMENTAKLTLENFIF